MNSQDPLWHTVKILPTDYKDYGGAVERWDLAHESYPDCSAGCQHWRPLWDSQTEWADADWGVCTKKHGPRAGLLTWEHQAGFGCFE
jgi:hypothetical protein